MRRPPRPPEESMLGSGLWPRVLLMGAFVAAVTLAAGVWARETGRLWQSMIFLVLGATQPGVALGSRVRPGSLANPFLLVAVGAALSLQVAGVYVPPLRDLLGTEPLSPGDLAIACALSGRGHVVMRAQARLWPERQPRAAPDTGGAPGAGAPGPPGRNGPDEPALPALGSHVPGLRSASRGGADACRVRLPAPPPRAGGTATRSRFSDGFRGSAGDRQAPRSCPPGRTAWCRTTVAVKAQVAAAVRARSRYPQV
ncbi:cation transporting ATPase C-terminal domain-containing protein [Streptomyces sp. NPDC059787]|uniref:cation transporting ATPase C-terminal domain-containing protein n=1 Tax=Streptomyces sp. NPDC059787 TaxID=3346947 RepID=UPI00365E5DC9